MMKDALESQPMAFVIDDDPSVCKELSNIFRSVGLRVEVFCQSFHHSLNRRGHPRASAREQFAPYQALRWSNFDPLRQHALESQERNQYVIVSGLGFWCGPGTREV